MSLNKRFSYKFSIVLNGILTILLLFVLFKQEIFQFFKVEEKVSIVMFGDSIIDDGNWNEVLRRNDVKKRGFRGFTTSHYRWILKDSILNYNSKFCFIIGGINDIGSGIPLSRTKFNYQCLIDSLISSNSIPVVQSTLYQENNLNSKVLVDSLNNFLIDYCKLKKVHYLDINAKLSTDKGLQSKYSKDGTHLTVEAYKIWGNEIKMFLDNFKSD